ncbi:MAG: site-specific integrase [Clostridia bacterium]|nr:site-specific integrase [Clostridia bacterium]
MPKEFQNLITIELPVPVRQKSNGVFEARLRKFGLNLAVSSKDYEKLKPKFLAALASSKLPTQGEAAELAEPAGAPLFETVALRWFELKRPTVKQGTITFYESLFRASLLPAFAGRSIDGIRQSDIQSVINDYIEAGKPRTATKVFQTMKAIFDFAVGDDLLEKSPMRLLKPPKYEEKNGCALTRAEERELIELITASECAPEVKNALVFLLYTGIRRSELASACIEGEFVSVVCSKMRKGYQERRRLIPITPMLARWLPAMNLDTLRTVNPDVLTQAMKRLMPNHHLHELRHTFITRAQECSVPREVVSVWAGHAADGTQTSNVYTHFGTEFMLKEGRKVIYNL